MPRLNCNAGRGRGLFAWALIATAVMACKPKVYPEAARSDAASEAELEATAALEASPEQAGTMDVKADAGGLPSSADAGSTGLDASSVGSKTKDPSTAIVVGRGGVFVNGDSNVITVTNEDRGCAPVALFRDRDGDGFGSDAPEDLIEGCPPMSGYALEGGDCHDAQPTMTDPAGDVFPNQTRFFAVGYPTTGGVSFDYDCSGSEEADPDGSFIPAPTDCEGRTFLACGAGLPGYIPSMDARSGAGVNPLCGVRERGSCFNVGTDCAIIRVSAGDPLPCH